jgi:hypothetical protein
MGDRTVDALVHELTQTYPMAKHSSLAVREIRKEANRWLKH